MDPRTCSTGAHVVFLFFLAGGIAGQSKGVPIKTRNWLLVTFLLFLPATVGSVLLLVKLREFYLGKWVEEREDEDYEDEGTTEGESEIERYRGRRGRQLKNN